MLGAAVGFGFAAFESDGYAFNALLTVRGLSLTGLVETELVRGVLTPFGHGLWTAILGGVLFREARRGRLRFTGMLLGMYLWVSVLHALDRCLRPLLSRFRCSPRCPSVCLPCYRS